MPYLKYLSSVKRNHIETKQKLIHEFVSFTWCKRLFISRKRKGGGFILYHSRNNY